MLPCAGATVPARRRGGNDRFFPPAEYRPAVGAGRRHAHARRRRTGAGSNCWPPRRSGTEGRIRSLKDRRAHRTQGVFRGSDARRRGTQRLLSAMTWVATSDMDVPRRSIHRPMPRFGWRCSWLRPIGISQCNSWVRARGQRVGPSLRTLLRTIRHTSVSSGRPCSKATSRRSGPRGAGVADGLVLTLRVSHRVVGNAELRSMSPRQ
jgi:hypothetical protein